MGGADFSGHTRCLITLENNHVERLFRCVCCYICAGRRLSSRNQTNSRKKKNADPGEVQIISIKNVTHGFSKKFFSSPNLISEAFFFINYLSESCLSLILPHYRKEQNPTSGEFFFKDMWVTFLSTFLCQ